MSHDRSASVGTASKLNDNAVDQTRRASAGEDMLLSMIGVISHAPSHALDFLTVPELLKLRLVSRTVMTTLREIEYHRCKDGVIYKVPFPGFPGLLDRRQERIMADDVKAAGDNGDYVNGLFPHQLASLQAMHKMENSQTHYGALRGGILADAPGLGKTISILGLIAQTAGVRPQVPKSFWEPQDIQEGWEALVKNPACFTEIAKAIAPFRSLVKYPQLLQNFNPPFPAHRFPRLKDFESFVKESVKDVATDGEWELFRRNVLNLQAGLHKSNRKLLKSEAGRRIAWERNLISATATLLVVPDALLEHWFQQIHQHMNLSLFTSAGTGNVRGLVYLDGVGDIMDARMPLGDVGNSESMLPAYQLANYMIVVTTFSRCEQEFHNEVRAGRMGKVVVTNPLDNRKRKRATQYQESDNDVLRDVSSSSSSNLLQLRWLRIVVDEGHELGTHAGGNGMTRFIHKMAAERRWVLSGTPTTGDENDGSFAANALDQLQRLLLFLRHPEYGSLPSSDQASAKLSPYVYDWRTQKSKSSAVLKRENAKAIWVTKVKQPFLQKKLEGRKELLTLLRNIMVMHKKEDINLPKPQFVQGEVEVDIPAAVQLAFQQDERSCARLLDEYLRTNDFQSLVDYAQSEYIIKTIQRAKKALEERGGPDGDANTGLLRMLSKEEAAENDTLASKKDRRAIKAVVYSSSKNNLRDVTESLYAKLDPENIAEAYDDAGFSSSSELSRFRHNQKEIRRCPVCGFQNQYDDAPRRRGRGEQHCENFLLEVVKTDDRFVRFLIEPERIVRAVPRNLGGNVDHYRFPGADLSSYRVDRKLWSPGDILEVDILDPHPILAKRKDQETWDSYDVDLCKQLARRERHAGRDWFFGPLPPMTEDPASRFVEVRLAKWQHCGKFHNPSRWYKGPRLAQSPVETIRENVFILSLDAGLAHGLDLSFVTHIFLLEPVEDAALLEQITSRAHRLGATGPVSVETVNVNYKLDPETQAAVDKSLSLLDRSSRKDSTFTKPALKSAQTTRERENGVSLTKVVCQFCYRSFNSHAEAESHEAVACSRNPANTNAMDPWHLSSVYGEIKPPPPKAPSAG